MAKRNSRLERITVASPCTVPWNEMARRSDGARHCAHCDTNVHDLSRMTPRQIEFLIDRTGGQFCGRVTRRPDGSLVTLPEFQRIVEPTSGPRLVSLNRAAPVAGVALSLMLGLGGAAFAQQPEVAADKTCQIATTPLKGPLPTDGDAALSGTVTDESGAVIAGATVELRHPATDFGTAIKTDGEGHFEFNGLRTGEYVLNVGAQNFKTRAMEIKVNPGEKTSITVALNVSAQDSISGIISIPEPTLAELISQSDLIAVATVNPAIEPTLTDEDKERLKDQKAQMAVLEAGWILAGPPPKAPIRIQDEIEQEPAGTDALYLLFLKAKKDAPDEYEQVAYSRRRLNRDEASAFEKRIAEFYALSATERLNPAARLEWILRCLTDPTTREEGAKLLLESLPAPPEADTETDTDEPETKPEYWLDLLDAAQRRKVADLLFNVKKLGNRENRLIAVVQKLGDERLPRFLLDRLKYDGFEKPRIAVSIADQLGEILDDETIKEEMWKLSEAGEALEQATEDAANNNDDPPMKPEAAAANWKRAISTFLKVAGPAVRRYRAKKP
jgi:hypothetical protein